MAPVLKMKIGIQTWGSDGDIRPLIALGGGLSRAGHDVTISITSVDGKNYDALCARLGVRAEHIECIRYTGEERRRIGLRMFGIRDPLKQLSIIFDYFFYPFESAIHAASKSLASENDALIGHMAMYPLMTETERAGKPYITVTMNPSGIPTMHEPPHGMPNFGKLSNILLWKLAEKVISSALLPKINSFRSRVGARPLTSFRQAWESRILNIIAVSPVFYPRQSDWDRRHQATGFLEIPPSAEQGGIPEDLASFIESGGPPLYMTFGSMLTANPDPEYITEAARLMQESAIISGQRAIIQCPWQYARGVPEDARIFRTGPVPHHRVFPKCSAVVHHGGSGTSQTASLHGKPSVVVAHVVDQIFWAEKLYKLGIAPEPMHRLSASPKKLSNLIDAALKSKDMRSRAEELGRKLQKEDGVGNAVRAVEAAVSKGLRDEM